MTAPIVQEKTTAAPNTAKKARYNPNHKKGSMNNQMASKLSELFKISQSNETKYQNHRHQVSTRSLQPLHQDSVDGVDHINFFTDVQTELGALLSTDNRLPFTYGPEKNSVDSEYQSIKCLWAYYRTSCLVPGFKSAPDYKIRKLYSTINSFPKQESIFAAMVLAYHSKMLKYPALAEAVVNCKLPFEYYSVRDGIKKRTVVSKLMINAMYEVKRALKFKTQPRLDSFLSKEDQAEAANVLPAFRHEYIVSILLGAENLKKRYFAALDKLSEEEKSKLTIDLGEPPYHHSKKEMDEVAGSLDIPTDVYVDPKTDGYRGTKDISGLVELMEGYGLSNNPNCKPPKTEVDLAVKSVSEDAVLGEVDISKGDEPTAEV